MSEIHLALAAELEKLAAGYRALAKSSEETSIQDISVVLSDKMRQGKAPAIRALLKKYDAEKLVEVRPKDYTAVLAEAMKL